MAAPFLNGLLLIASGATAAGEDGAKELPHLELPGTAGEDGAKELPHLELPGTADSGGGHSSDAPPQGLMGIMSMGGCGSFAGLLAATPNASDIFEERLAAGGGGLTVFCPDDRAVAAFEPTFRALADNDRLDVLLHHGAVARYGRVQLAAFDWVAVRTLAAADAATNKTQSIIVRDDGDTVWLWPSPSSCQCGAVRVIKTISSDEGPLIVYLVDAVLLPGHLRQKPDGGDGAASRGGYLRWLHCCIPLWGALSWGVAPIVGQMLAAWLASFRM